jgi:hypothetical protein
LSPLVFLMSYRILFFILWVMVCSLLEVKVHNMSYLHS